MTQNWSKSVLLLVLVSRPSAHDLTAVLVVVSFQVPSSQCYFIPDLGARRIAAAAAGAAVVGYISNRHNTRCRAYYRVPDSYKTT